MIDLSLNSDFSVHLNDRGDLATVSGRDAFEQSVSISLTKFFNSGIIGDLDEDSVVQKIRLEVIRTAREEDWIDDIENIAISPSSEEPHTYEVEIVYSSDELFSMMISE